MELATLFTLAKYESLANSMIAALVFEAGAKNVQGIDRAAIESISFECISGSGGNIIRSERTRKKIIKNLRHKDVFTIIDTFRKRGKPVADDYFQSLICKSISSRNAATIAPEFTRLFRERIAGDGQLASQIVARYRNAIENGDWDDIEIDRLEETLSGSVITPENRSIDSEDEMLDRARENGTMDKPGLPATLPEVEHKKNGSAADTPRPMARGALSTRCETSMQAQIWNQNEYVLPVRGMRNLESQLDVSPLLLVTGPAGSGKSTLISAYVQSLIDSGKVDPDEIFYFRFRDGVADYHTFSRALAEFLSDAERLDAEVTLIYKNLPSFVSRLPTFFILDDLHEVLDLRLANLIRQIWTKLATLNEYHGKLILINREMIDDLPIESNQHLFFSGLSKAESAALLSDKWKLNLESKTIRLIGAQLRGNPGFMLLFRSWWRSEAHTDTELDRFLDRLPEADHAVAEYILDHLYQAIERMDYRLNNLLTAASFFRMPETEDFYENIYNKLGGGSFQMQLETLVEDFKLAGYDNNLNRYELMENVRYHYYTRVNNKQTWRILHYTAAHLYERRSIQLNFLPDSLESAHHFLRADREEETAKLVHTVLDSQNLSSSANRQVLGILREFHLSLLKSDEQRMLVLYNRGNLYLQFGNPDLAETDLNNALDFEMPDDLRASTFYSLGLIERGKEKLNTATERLHDALEIYRKIEHNDGITASSLKLADIYILQGETEIAAEILKKAGNEFAVIEDLRCSMEAFTYLGTIYHDRSDLDNADIYFRKVIHLASRLSDDDALANALYNVGQIEEVRGDLDEALSVYHEELRIREKISDWLGAAKANEAIGHIHRFQGAWELTLGYYSTAQRIFEENEYLYGMAQIYYHIGEIHQIRSEMEEAMAYYKRSLSLFESIEHDPGVAQAYTSIATIYKASEDWENALENFETALTLRQGHDDLPSIASIYEHIGDVHRDQSENKAAMEIYTKCIGLKEQLNDHIGISQMYFNLGSLNKLIGESEQAISSFQNALAILEADPYAYGEARAYQELGKIFLEQDNFEQTMHYFSKALESFTEIDHAQGIAETAYSIGNLSHDAGDWEKALKYYLSALPMYERIVDFDGIAQTLGNVSSIEFERKKYDTAIFRQLEILLYFQSTEQDELSERIISNLVACHQELGPDTFQPILNKCLEHLSEDGVVWGNNEVIPAAVAERNIQHTFFSA